MFSIKVKTAARLALACAILLGAGIGVSRFWAEEPPTKDAAKSADKIAKMLGERRDVAVKEMKLRRELYRRGVVTLDSLAGASQRLLKAELAVRKDKATRIAAHEQYVKIVQELARTAKSQLDAGQLGEGDYLQAEYARLDAEIGLEQEKARK